MQRRVLLTTMIADLIAYPLSFVAQRQCMNENPLPLDLFLLAGAVLQGQYFRGKSRWKSVDLCQ